MPDFESHRFNLATQLMIPKTQDLNALFSEELVSLLVSGAFIGKTVTPTVEFDSKPGSGTVEIEKIDPARVLPTEFAFGEATVPKQPPEPPFGGSGFLAKLASELAGPWRPVAVSAILRHLSHNPVVIGAGADKFVGNIRPPVIVDIRIHHFKRSQLSLRIFQKV